MANQQYTERQLKIISGEIPMETIDGRDATWLYKKAIENGDAELAEKALRRKELAKDEARKRNIKRTVKNKALRRKGITCWRQPKTNEYTERHKQIIKGEIPFDTIHTNELISLHQKARNNQDFVLAEMLYEQIAYRRERERLKEKARREKYKERHKIIDDFEDYDPKSPIPLLGQAILNGAVNLLECPEEEIIKLITQLEEIGDKETLKIAKQFLSYKRDTLILYPTKNHWDAVNMLEELLQLPIRRPKDWFVEE